MRTGEGQMLQALKIDTSGEKITCYVFDADVSAKWTKIEELLDTVAHCTVLMLRSKTHMKMQIIHKTRIDQF